jgi:hypothetical protein
MSVDRLNMQGKAKSAKDKEACHFDAVIAHRCLFVFLHTTSSYNGTFRVTRRPLLSRRHIMPVFEF